MAFIFHKKYGRGEIKKKRFGGFEVYVLFEDGISRWIRSDQVKFSEKRPPIIPPTIGNKLPKEVFSAREIIESLRLGIVPYKHVDKITFGREEEFNKLKKWLEDKDTHTLALLGEYGVGKTHFLNHIYCLAIKDNWAVSIINLDINEVSFYKPKNLYREIIRNLRTSKGGFREFLKEVLNSEDAFYLEEHKYFRRVLELVNLHKDTEEMWDWIEGVPITGYRPPLPEYSTCANVYSYLITAIGWMAKNILNMKGFLLLFDEAESVEPYWYSTYQNEKAQNFLKGLVRAIENDESLLEEEIYYGFETGWRYKGKRSSLQYCGRIRVPFLWKVPTYVKGIFALPPMEKILERAPFRDISKLTLEQLQRPALEEIFYTVLKLYKRAYGFEPNIEFNKLSFNKGIRLFVKEIIELLDKERFYMNGT